MFIQEQEDVLKNDKKHLLVSASAGSGKTYVMIKYIMSLICDKSIPVREIVALTFTKAAANQLKEKLAKELKKREPSPFIVEQIDALSTSNISTIHSFFEKNLRKYANLLNLSENFSILDESEAQKLRENAFELAYKNFQDEQVFLQFNDVFKNDRQKIKGIIFKVEELSNSVALKEDFLRTNVEKPEMYFQSATDFLIENTKKVLWRYLKIVEKLHVDDFYYSLYESLRNIMASPNFFDLCIACQNFAFPKLPLKKSVGEEIIERLQKIRKSVNKAIDKIKGLNIVDKESFDYQKSGELEKLVIHLFELYENQENRLKRTKNALDFYDLEKYMDKLSSKENLFDGIKYVFVDEYQDTNKIQEKIIKNIAKNSNFVAVGDVKQGIYGFRLASAEIFFKDLENFQKEEDGDVKFLKYNFRSNQKVLDFVNNIFEICMTKDLTGVDYHATSMLKSPYDYVFDGNSPVNIDLVDTSPSIKEELPKIYSVKNANIYTENQNEILLNDIRRRISEVLSSQIYDSETETFRRVTFSDIAILSRGRNDFFNELETYLQNHGIPIISNSRKKLLEEPEIMMLLNYLKLALVMDDDVCCLSVLAGLYHISYQQIVEQKKDDGKSLCEIVVEDKSGIFSQFNKNLQDFRKNSAIFGLKKAFLTLFSECNYRSYINLNKPGVNIFVDKFLEEVGKFDFDLPSLIQYLSSVEIIVTADVSVVEDSILLTTIHDSKGLEYPIVFLINCDASLSKSGRSVDVAINERFGLGLKIYDQENNSEKMSARMLAVKESQKKQNFEEEMMIFYVALTRAKNRLYLFGQYRDYSKTDILECDTYFDLVFHALAKPYSQFLKEDKFQNDILCITHVENVEEIVFGEKQNLENMEKSQKVVDKIEKYLSFSYDFSENQNYRLKESVTSLNKKTQEDELEKFNNDNFVFSGNLIEVGNAYHTALKMIDFEKVTDSESLDDQLSKCKNLFDFSLLDKSVLLKNIQVLQSLTAGAKIYKEREFIMKEKIGNLLDNSYQNEILVQGVIDLFAVKENEVILVDYKYSSKTDENYLLNKYKNQLKLYKIALENAYKIRINQIYLLSLKNAKLIKVDF